MIPHLLTLNYCLGQIRTCFTLKESRNLHCLFSKCVNEIGPSSVHDLFSTKELPYHLRDPSKIEQPKVDTTTFGLNSLKYLGSNLWNKLPANLKDEVDVKVFKNLLKTWKGPLCKCGICTLCNISH